MEPFFAPAFGVMVAVAAYLLMSRNLLRMLLGLLVMGNAANLGIFIAGRLSASQPPIVPEGQLTVALSANPLPQVLFQSAHRDLDTMDTDEMRVAEPPQEAP